LPDPSREGPASSDPMDTDSASPDPKGTDSASLDPGGAGSVSHDPEGVGSVLGGSAGLMGARIVSNTADGKAQAQGQTSDNGKGVGNLDVTRGRDRPCLGTHDVHSIRQADTMPHNSCMVSVKGTRCPRVASVANGATTWIRLHRHLRHDMELSPSSSIGPAGPTQGGEG
jgi:hypothetical protein